jgi:cation-transporting ATPase F
MLTGESHVVAKSCDPLPAETVLADRTNMAYAVALVIRGWGEGIVVATGNRTEVGRISSMIAGAEEIATPLTRKIAVFSRVLLWIILSIASISFVLGIAHGNEWTLMFKAAVALAVSAIPEGLPAAVTIMLAVGVARMARRQAIIRKLPAVEALGSTTVICSDKTGTLTQNQMAVRTLWAGGREFTVTGTGYDPTGSIIADQATALPADHPALVELLVCGALCNEASLVQDGRRWDVRGDPTEGALIVAARKLNPPGTPSSFSQEVLAERYPRVDTIPFESERQYMATLHRTPEPNGRVLFVKGSVERLLPLCTHMLDAFGKPVGIDRESVLRTASRLASRGLRVLAFARRELPGVDEVTREMLEHTAPGTALTLLGIQAMLDPPRPEAIEAVATCRSAGIRVKMITGDHALTAASIARMMNIGDQDDSGAVRVLTGAELANIADDRLPVEAEGTAVFARMTPEQKLRLVKALQGHGHIVAMTGDGVNDAPALRQADIGIAMGLSGTEVAKSAADIVLADDNFASIVAAVEEGRTVFDNLTKFIIWTLPTNGGEAALILAAIVLDWPLPVLPVQSLYINLTTAVLLGMPLVFEASEPDVMARPPHDPHKPIITIELFMRTGLVSLLLCGGGMSLFHWELTRGVNEAVARTAAVTVIVLGEAFYLFSSRALLRPAWSVPLFSNSWLWAGIAAMLLVQFAAVHVPALARLFHFAPIDAGTWARAALIGAAVLIIVEMEKAIRRAVSRARVAIAG